MDLPDSIPAPDGWVPNLTFVLPDLAIGGHVPPERVGHLAAELGIGAVVDLREEDRDEEDALRRHGIAFLHLPTVDHGALAPADIAAGTAFGAEAERQGRRLLVHCQHGIGRSATLALAILVERGFAPMEALRLAKDRRALVSPSPAQYEGWAAWLRGRGTEPPDFVSFAAVAYRHLAAG